MRAVDLFAGFGGATMGLQQAGIDVVVAANHWGLAVETHRLNHPETHHETQDLRQADFSTWPDFDLLWASPSCLGNSTAAQPARKRSRKVQVQHDAYRSTAWAVIEAAEVKAPEYVVVENVLGFRSWTLYPVWKMALQTLGYAVTENVLTASRWGVPQRRQRLFIIARRGLGHGITISDPDVPETPIGPYLEFDTGRWRALDQVPAGPQRRAAAGRARGLGDRFVLQNVTGHRGLPLTEPIRTVTTGDQWAIVDGDRYRTLTIRENMRAMGINPDTTRLLPMRRNDALTMIGNAVVPAQACGIGLRLLEAA